MSETKFNVAVINVFDLEGGLSKDPDDPGGTTKFGISQKEYPCKDIESLTMQEATDIYYWDYWIKSNIDLIDDGILCKVMFAAIVNMGISRAVKLLQKACNVFGAGIKEDGVIGYTTSDWINKFPHHTALMAATKYYLAGFYISLKKPKYIAGWLKRLEI